MFAKCLLSTQNTQALCKVARNSLPGSQGRRSVDNTTVAPQHTQGLGARAPTGGTAYTVGLLPLLPRVQTKHPTPTPLCFRALFFLPFFVEFGALFLLYCTRVSLLLCWPWLPVTRVEKLQQNFDDHSSGGNWVVTRRAAPRAGSSSFTAARARSGVQGWWLSVWQSASARRHVRRPASQRADCAL